MTGRMTLTTLVGIRSGLAGEKFPQLQTILTISTLEASSKAIELR